MGNASDLEALAREVSDLGNVDRVDRALKVYVASQLISENQSLGLLETLESGCEYWASTFSGTASGSAKTLGPTGAAGDVLHGIVIYNGSASAITACTIQDGATTLAWLDTGALKTLAPGATGVYLLPKPMKSQNGAWRVTVTCGGTMASIQVAMLGAPS